MSEGLKRPPARGFPYRRLLVWLALPLVFAWLLRETSLADLQRILGGLRPLGLAALVVFNLIAALLFVLASRSGIPSAPARRNVERESRLEQPARQTA